MRRKFLFIIALSGLFIGCSENSETVIEELTGNELVYDLMQSSDFPISGTVIFQERTDGNVQVVVSLEGTEGDIFHPVHLHFGDLSVPDADIAFLLNDLKGSDGKSSTTVVLLSDETKFTFDAIDQFNGSVKVHLGSIGADADVILAAGNIGSNKQLGLTGRQKVAICNSY